MKIYAICPKCGFKNDKPRGMSGETQAKDGSTILGDKSHYKCPNCKNEFIVTDTELVIEENI